MQKTKKQTIISGTVITLATIGLVALLSTNPSKELSRHCFQGCVATENSSYISINDWQCIACMYDYEIKKMSESKFVIMNVGKENIDKEIIKALNTTIRQRDVKEYKLKKDSEDDKITKERFLLMREIFLNKAEGMDPSELIKVFDTEE